MPKVLYTEDMSSASIPRKRNLETQGPTYAAGEAEDVVSDSGGALIAQEEFNLLAFVKEMYASYKWYLKHYPVSTKAITSSTIAMMGEVLGSVIRARKGNVPWTVSPKRVAMFGTFGLCVTGPWLHFWYIVMEYVITVKLKLTGKGRTAAKVLLDRCLWGPPYTFFTVCFLTYFQCFSTEQTWREVRNKYYAILIMSQKVWVPAQLVNFEAVPQEFQVLFVSLVNVAWNTYLSLAN